ncbi:S locus-related glycoprotein 1 binding pollen coat [Cucumis melo var. makuwa]|uniref:S locus-related glycoprotein 1 binding pollen coat n=1 Tax=Cucumis melo var. makuwa TaxID=1194695 RepID=A0A5A7TGA0_CUCMM|nr:S locus-related glycoprotein 1 binding pollen coat [Cucumis melo var. makuwa]
MKSVSFSAILLALLLIFSGETMMKSVEGVGGLCEKALHGGGCKDVECLSGCKALFGKARLRSARVGSKLLAVQLAARLDLRVSSAHGMARSSVG